MAFVFGLQTLLLIDFTKIYQLEGSSKKATPTFMNILIRQKSIYCKDINEGEGNTFRKLERSMVLVILILANQMSWSNFFVSCKKFVLETINSPILTACNSVSYRMRCLEEKKTSWRKFCNNKVLWGYTGKAFFQEMPNLSNTM